jgi:hypothetical protein
VKFFHQAIKCPRLFDGIQVLALNIFYKCELKRLLIAYFPQYHRQSQKLRPLRGPPSSLSGDELIPGSNSSRD